MYHRNVRERVSMIAPFAHLDQDPYLVISPEGAPTLVHRRLTVTDRFPTRSPLDVGSHPQHLEGGGGRL